MRERESRIACTTFPSPSWAGRSVCRLSPPKVTATEAMARRGAARFAFARRQRTTPCHAMPCRHAMLRRQSAVLCPCPCPCLVLLTMPEWATPCPVSHHNIPHHPKPQANVCVGEARRSSMAAAKKGGKVQMLVCTAGGRGK